MDRAERPSREQIVQTIQHIIAEHMHVSPTEITENKDMQKDFGADSLDAVEIQTLLEDGFDIKITEDGESARTVGDLVNLVYQKTQGIVAGPLAEEKD